MRSVLLSSVILAASASWAASAAPVDYTRDVKPILQERCFACHGALQQKGKLRLDSGALIMKGGAHGPAVVPGKPSESLLLARVSDSDEESRMPPEGLPLKPEQIAILKLWIETGAPYPADDQPEPDPRDHWAFRPPIRPPVPATAAGGNPIDAFLEAELAKRKLTPQKPADPRLLLRRVYLDLIGLPPTPEQIDAFLKDPSPLAYEKVVDQLLESPHYGERWGRHFMDIWRYSDWWGLGAEVRNSQKHIWHWRDWIIESLNADKGYDQMVREMLAADELYPTDSDRLRATGFLARQYFIFNRTTWLDETIEHTAKAFLGLTMNCTKCHEHKYDPFSHTDYYRLRAFFEPYQIRTDMVPDEPDFEKNGIPRVFDCNLDAPTYRHRRGDDRDPITSVKIAPGLPEILGGTIPIEPVVLPAEAVAPHLKPWVEDTYRRVGTERVAAARTAVEKARAALARAEQTARNRPSTNPAAATKRLAFDDFSRPNPDLWQLGPGQWTYDKGVLAQTKPDGERSSIRLKANVPTDFAATLQFTFRGGDPWRSVGLNFDVVGARDVLVYASAFEGGPKLQIAYKPGAGYEYPTDGLQNRPFKLGDTVELTIRVRGTLINVAVNGEHALAYRLPIKRTGGAIELMTFAAAAEFRRFELRELPPDEPMLAPPSAGKDPTEAAMSVEQARWALTAAEKALAAAEAEQEALSARFAAERLKYSAPLPGSLVATAAALEAARSEARIALWKAEEALAQAEMELAGAGPMQKPVAEKKREAAQQQVATARNKVAAPGLTYSVPRASLKTRESNIETEESRQRPFPSVSSGRRTALARWITDRNNPLSARVAVNHVWLRHFGAPLVPTVFDFGRKGLPPTHPELLDWLAVEFMEHGWSLKHLHRLMVTSAAYRRSSSAAGLEDVNRADPANRYYWRMNAVRMDAQTIRDSLLHLAGRLDPTRGGPSIPVTMESNRRSIYYVHSHNDHQKFLMQFDDAAVRECYRRTESIVPQQALTLSNSKFALAQAETLAARIGARPDDEFIQTAFRWILGTEPSDAERTACRDALVEWKKILADQKHADPGAKARANLIGVLLNHNDFVTIR